MATANPLATRLPSRQEIREVEAAWEAFISGCEEGLKRVRPVIRESWQRCRRLGVDPYLKKIPLALSARELELLQERADLLDVTGPLFETVLKAWEGERFLLGLNNRQGHILYLRGHPWIMERAAELNAVPGGSMAEEQVGTAVTNVVLATGRPDYVLWSEHYCYTFHSWASLGAPIYHVPTGEMVGVVVAAGYKLTHPRALELTCRIAARIEQLLHHEELARRMALLDQYQRYLLRYPNDMIVALDGRGHIWGLSPPAARLFSDPQQALGQSLFRLSEIQVQGLCSVAGEKHLQPYGLQVLLPGQGLAFPATALPVPGEKQPLGTLLVLSSPKPPRNAKTPPTSWQARYTFADLVGKARSFQTCLDLARKAAREDFSVLLLGESGTGKELLAQAIHTASSRSRGPFVAVNCGLAQEELLAAELFGYVDGAFTGAVKGGKRGKFELAHRGTLFLDEVDSMPPKMQIGLLRALEEGKIVRMGSEEPTSVDVRIIAASNEDLKQAVEEKRFRLDLYQRLASFPIFLPPLRERKEDLPLLARHLLDQLGFAHLHLTPEALALLSRYSWPGNVRELRNVLLRAAHLARGPALTPQDLPAEITAKEPPPPPAGSLREAERELAESQGNMAQAAARLGIHRATLYRKLKKYGVSAACP